jgi:hypothetical protein
MTVLVILSTRMNQGRLIYPIDDTYIHMAIAKNTALHGVWGVTTYEFTSSTSSPLWTFLIALIYFAFGVNDGTPFMLNLLLGACVIIMAYYFLERHLRDSRRWFRFLILMTVIFVTPLAPLTFSGMEHVLHMLLTLCFVYLSIANLAGRPNAPIWNTALLIVIAPFLVMSRYEGAFLVCVVCFFFLLQRRILPAALIGLIALLPIVLYGLWSVAHGWYFLPNSVLLKGQVPDSSLKGIFNLLVGGPQRIQENAHVLLLLIASLALLFLLYRDTENPLDPSRKYIHLIFVGTLLLHMQFAQAGWFYRYEAYIVLLGIMTVGIAISDRVPKIAWDFNKRALQSYALLFFLAGVIALPFSSRAMLSLVNTPQATNNIYEQQYQMGLFLKQFYQGSTVMVNDIGAVTYLADIRLLDMWGLGSLEPARLKMQQQYTAQHINVWSQQQGVTIAIVYDRWFERDGFGGIPPQWVQVGQWRIANNVVAGEDTVSLYAAAATMRDDLMKNLRQFATELPGDVAQYGEYVQ